MIHSFFLEGSSVSASHHSLPLTLEHHNVRITRLVRGGARGGRLLLLLLLPPHLLLCCLLNCRELDLRSLLLLLNNLGASIVGKLVN